MKTKLLTLALLLPFLAMAQNKANLMLSQDVRLATIGDDIGNDAFTPNLRLRSEWQGNQLLHGYFFGAPEIEYADLRNTYVRTSLNLGFRHNMFSDIFDISYSLGYGMIARERSRGWLATQQLSGDLYLYIKVSDKLSIFVNGQVVDRNDLEKRKIVYSNFVGIAYDF